MSTLTKAEKEVRKIVNDMIGEIRYGWPPICSGTFYQPERPHESGKKAPQNEQ